MLKRAGIGSFRHLQDDPPSRQVVLPVTSASTRQMVWQDGRGYGSGSGSYLTFALDQPQLVYAVRLRYSYPKGAPASFRMAWGQSGQGDFSESGSASVLLPLPRCPEEKESDEQTVTIWVNATIDRFRVYPDDKPYVFKLSEVVLLVPVTGSQNSSNQ
jgi:hypothetical protein